MTPSRTRLAAAAALLALPALATAGRADAPSPSPSSSSSSSSSSSPSPSGSPTVPPYHPPVLVAITTVAPQVLTADGAVLVSGTLVNTTAKVLTDVTVSLATTAHQYYTRAELNTGRAAPQSLTLQATPVPLERTVATLPTGGPQAFSITVPHASQLGLLANAVTPLAVVAFDDTGTELGVDAVSEPYFPDPGAAAKLGVSTVIPLTAPPDWTPANPGGSELAGDLGPTGRLTTVLGAISAAYQGPGPYPAITLAVDPALLEQVNALATSPFPAAASPVPAALRQAAQAWSRDIKYLAGLPSVTISALPYGDADLFSLASSGLADARNDGVRLLTEAPDLVRAQLGGGLATVVSEDPILTPDSRMAPATVNLATAAGAQLAIVSYAQLTPTTPTPLPNQPLPATQTDVAQLVPEVGALVGTPTGSSRTPARLAALATDEELQNLLTDTVVPAFAGRASAELLAELAMITSEAPFATAANGGQRGVVLVAPRNWSPPAQEITDLLTGLGQAKGWLTTLTPQRNLETKAPLPLFPDRTPAGLDLPGCQAAGAIAATEDLRPDVVALHDLDYPTSDAVSAPLALSLDRSLSFYWRLPPTLDCSTSPPTKATPLRDAVTDAFAGTIARIGVQVAKSRLLTGPSGSLPLDLSNQLGRKVRLRLTLQSDEAESPDTVSARPLVVTLPANSPGSKVQYELEVTARRLGTHDAVVAVSTESGKLLFTTPTITIRSTAYGIVSVGITAGALAVLLLAFLVRGYRWLRRRRRTAGTA